MIIFAFIIIWIACAFYCGAVADSKGHDSVSWFFGGFFFGVFALIAVAGLDDKELKQYVRSFNERENRSQNSNSHNNNDDDDEIENEEEFSKEDREKVWAKIQKKRNNEMKKLRKLDEKYMEDMEN